MERKDFINHISTAIKGKRKSTVTLSEEIECILKIGDEEEEEE